MTHSCIHFDHEHTQQSLCITCHMNRRDLTSENKVVKHESLSDVSGGHYYHHEILEQTSILLQTDILNRVEIG